MRLLIGLLLATGCGAVLLGRTEAQTGATLDAARQQEIASLKAEIQRLEPWAVPGKDVNGTFARTLQLRREQLAILEGNSFNGPATFQGGYANAYGIPAGELERANAEIVDFAQRDAERAQQEINAAEQYYSSERNRIQREFAAAHDNLDRGLRALEASEEGRRPNTDKIRREAQARVQYNQQRQELINLLIGEGVDPSAASAVTDNYLESLIRDSAWVKGIDAAIQDPNAFTPGSAFSNYPALDGGLENRTGESRIGAPPQESLEQYDPLMKPWGGTLDEWENQRSSQLNGTGTGFGSAIPTTNQTNSLTNSPNATNTSSQQGMSLDEALATEGPLRSHSFQRYNQSSTSGIPSTSVQQTTKLSGEVSSAPGSYSSPPSRPFPWSALRKRTVDYAKNWAQSEAESRLLTDLQLQLGNTINPRGDVVPKEPANEDEKEFRDKAKNYADKAVERQIDGFDQMTDDHQNQTMALVYMRGFSKSLGSAMSLSLVEMKNNIREWAQQMDRLVGLKLDSALRQLSDYDASKSENHSEPPSR